MRLVEVPNGDGMFAIRTINPDEESQFMRTTWPLQKSVAESQRPVDRIAPPPVAVASGLERRRARHLYHGL